MRLNFAIKLRHTPLHIQQVICLYCGAGCSGSLARSLFCILIISRAKRQSTPPSVIQVVDAINKVINLPLLKWWIKLAQPKGSETRRRRTGNTIWGWINFNPRGTPSSEYLWATKATLLECTRWMTPKWVHEEGLDGSKVMETKKRSSNQSLLRAGCSAADRQDKGNRNNTERCFWTVSW